MKTYSTCRWDMEDATYIAETTDELLNASPKNEVKWRISLREKRLNKKEKLRLMRNLSRRHASGVRALGQLALNSYVTQQSYTQHNRSFIYFDNITEKSSDYSGSDNLIPGNSNPGHQARTEHSTADDAQGATGVHSTYKQSTEQNERNNTPNNTATTTRDIRPVIEQDNQRPAQRDDETADIKLSKLAQICSTTDDTEETPVTRIVQQPNDQVYLPVKEPNYRGQGSESAGNTYVCDRVSEPSTDTSGTTCYEAREHTITEVLMITPCAEEYDVNIKELMPLSVTMKKSDDDEDPYSRAIRDLVTVPHDFAPERVVTPVYTVPRYPDNHNPLLPLALQKRLDEMSPREFLTYVLNELTLEERETLMVDERQRRKTFLVNWPYENQLNGIKMAQAGFYSVDDYDRVQCVFCRGSVHRWRQHEVPMLEHARSFAFCRFVKGFDCGNREYRSHKLTKEDMKNINLYKQPDMTPNRDGSLETDSSALGISTNRAAMVENAPDASRLKTYNRWPASSPLAAADLCVAGFYFTGFDDQVRCFYCAGGIREWSTTDDPWEEHARWFPECEYVLQKKGESFVNDVHARTPANKKNEVKWRISLREKHLNKKEKLRLMRNLSRRHASGVRALGQLALNSYIITQQSYTQHNPSFIYFDNITEKSSDYSGSDNLIPGNSNPGHQVQKEHPTADDAQGKAGIHSTYRQSTEQNERNNTPDNTSTTTRDTRPVIVQDIQHHAQGDDATADIGLSKPAQSCSPTDDTEETPDTGIVQQPNDDQVYLPVKEPNYRGQGSESAGNAAICDRVPEPSTDISGTTCYEAREHIIPEVVTITPCSEECDVNIKELMPLSVTMKKSDDDEDPYRRTIRDLVTIPHDFAPERVVTPVYTVPRYPDNHNPLLPLALQKRLDEMSPREFLTYVLNELTLEERESLMVDERQRRKTFLVNWPYENQLNGIKMAQAGFYLVDDYDRVQCAFCRGSLHRWEQDDVPMLKHDRSFAFCRFVKGLNCGNREYRSHKLTKEDMKHINLYKQPVTVSESADEDIHYNTSALQQPHDDLVEDCGGSKEFSISGYEDDPYREAMYDITSVRHLSPAQPELQVYPVQNDKSDGPLGAAAAGESVSMLDNEPPNDVAADDSAAEARPRLSSNTDRTSPISGSLSSETQHTPILSRERQNSPLMINNGCNVTNYNFSFDSSDQTDLSKLVAQIQDQNQQRKLNQVTNILVTSPSISDPNPYQGALAADVKENTSPGGVNVVQEISKLKQQAKKQADQLQQQGSQLMGHGEQLKEQGEGQKRTHSDLTELGAKHQELCDKQEYGRKQMESIASNVTKVEELATENTQSVSHLEHEVNGQGRTLAANVDQLNDLDNRMKIQAEEQKTSEERTHIGLTELGAKHQKLCDKQEHERKQMDTMTESIALNVTKMDKLASVDQLNDLENQLKVQAEEQKTSEERTRSDLTELGAKHQKLCDKQEYEKKQADIEMDLIASDVTKVEKKATDNAQRVSQLEHQVNRHSRALADNDLRESQGHVQPDDGGDLPEE